jgi:hypothetical protein
LVEETAMHAGEYKIPSDILSVPAIEIDELEVMLAGESMPAAKGGGRRARADRRARGDAGQDGRRRHGRAGRR